MIHFLDLYEKFYRMEERENLFGHRVKGRVVWDYLRYYVLKVLEKRLVQQDQIVYRTKRSLSVQIRDSIGVLRDLIRINLKENRLKSSHDLVVINYSRKTMVDGKSVNSQFYLIANALKDRYRVLLIDPSRYHEEVEKFYDCDVIRSTPWHYKAKLKSRFIRYSREDQLVFAAIHDVISREFQFDIDMATIVRQGFSYQLMLGQEFAKVFKRARPRLILHSDTGGCKGWIEEAHQLGIPVVDCQHSIIWKGSILCNYRNGIEKQKLKTLSDYIFTFAESWHPQYQCPAKKIAVGHPLMDLKLDEISKKMIPSKKAILFISTKRSGRTLEGLALDLASLLPDYKILYKLRREEFAGWRNVYSRALSERPNITVIDHENKSLYDYFAEAKYIVGDASMAVVEGMAAGLIPFIIQHGLHVVLETYVQQGSAFLIRTAGEIEQIIRRGDVLQNPLPREHLFRSGSRANLVQAVDAIFKSKGKEGYHHGSIS